MRCLSADDACMAAGSSGWGRACAKYCFGSGETPSPSAAAPPTPVEAPRTAASARFGQLHASSPHWKSPSAHPLPNPLKKQILHAPGILRPTQQPRCKVNALPRACKHGRHTDGWRQSTKRSLVCQEHSHGSLNLSCDATENSGLLMELRRGVS